MSIAQAFLAEFEQELVATRKCLERLPADKFGWQPHERSLTLGQLANHIAGIPGFIYSWSVPDVFDLPESGPGWTSPASTEELVATLEQGAETLRSAFKTLPDERIMQNWTIRKNGKELVTMPRVALLRSILLNHLYHHRGQLTVYMRQLEIAVPSIYGSSADETPDFLKDETVAAAQA